MSESPLHAGLTHLPDVKGKIPGKMRKGEKMGDLRFFPSFFFVPFLFLLWRARVLWSFRQSDGY